MSQIEHSHPEGEKKKYEQKDMSGSLFINRKKLQDNSPDMTGDVKVGGHTYRIAAWNKTSKGGVVYLSLSFSEPREQRTGQSAQVSRIKHPEASVASLLQELQDIKGGKVSQDDVPF